MCQSCNDAFQTLTRDGESRRNFLRSGGALAAAPLAAGLATREAGASLEASEVQA